MGGRNALLDGIHMRPPRSHHRRRRPLELGRQRNGLVRHRLAHYAIDKLNLEVAERSAKRHAIAAIGPGGQADDEDLLELYGKRELLARRTHSERVR